MRGRPKKIDKKKKKKQADRQSANTTYIETAPMQLSAVQAVALMKEMMQGTGIFTPIEGSSEEVAEKLNELKKTAQAGVKLMEEGVKTLESDDIAIVNQTNEMGQLVASLKSTLIDAAKVLVGGGAVAAKEEELIAPGKEAIDFLIRITKLPNDKLIQYVKAGFKDEYALEVPSNYLGTEVLKLFIQNLGYNLLFAAPKHGCEEHRGFFIVTMELVEKLKNMRLEWIKFFGQFTPVSILLEKHQHLVTPVYTDGILVIANKNTAKQVSGNQVFSLLEIPMLEMPQACARIEKFLKLVEMIDKYELVARIVVVNGMIAIVPFRTHDNLDWLKLRCVKMGEWNRYLLEYKDMDSFSDDSIKVLDAYLQNQVYKLSLLNLFNEKNKNVFKDLQAKLMFEGEFIQIEMSARVFAIMQPIVQPLNMTVFSNENDKVVTTVTINDFSNCLEMDLSYVVKEIENNEAIAAKFDVLKDQYGERFLQDVSFTDVLGLSVDVLQQKADELREADERLVKEKQARKEAARLAAIQKEEAERLRNDKVELLQGLLTAELFSYRNWSDCGNRLTILRVTSIERCFFGLQKISGLTLAEDAPHVSLDLAKVDEMSLDDVKTLVEKSLLFAKKMKIVDHMVCLVRGSKSDRFTDTGMKFIFRDEERHTEFLKACKSFGVLTLVDGFYHLPLAFCNDAAVSVELLQEKLMALTACFTVVKAKVEEPRVKSAKLKKDKGDGNKNNDDKPKSNKSQAKVKIPKKDRVQPISRIPEQSNAKRVDAALPPAKNPAGAYNSIQASDSQMDLVPAFKTKTSVYTNVTYTPTVFVPKISCEPIDKIFTELSGCLVDYDFDKIMHCFIELGNKFELAHKLHDLGKINLDLLRYIQGCRDMISLTLSQNGVGAMSEIIMSEARRGIQCWMESFVPAASSLRGESP